jgi:predicted nucleic acid-binding protein
VEGVGKTALPDTSVAIAAMKGEAAALQVYAAGEKKAAVAGITVFELMRRQTKLGEVERFLREVDVIPFDGKAGREAAATEKFPRR